MIETELRFSLYPYLPVILYLFTGMVYAHTHPYTIDEYCNCRNIYEILTGEVYRDFQPWNSVLGHYIHMPAALVNIDLVLIPINIRIWIVMLNAIFLMITLRTILIPMFGNRTAFMAILMLATTSLFVSQGMVVRLDMLSAWFGMFALVLAIKKRWLVSGLLCALAFTISQKGVYHIVSLNIVLLFLFFTCRQYRQTIKNTIRFNAGAIGGILLYYTIVLLQSGSVATIVAKHTHKAQYMLQQYTVHNIIKAVIRHTVYNNYLFILLSLGGFILAIVRYYQNRDKKNPSMFAVLIPYTIAMMILCFFVHPHPYIYFFVILLPLMLLLSATFIQFLHQKFQTLSSNRKADTMAFCGVLMGAAIYYRLPERIWPIGHQVSLIFTIIISLLALSTMFYFITKRFSKNSFQASIVFTAALSLLIIASADTTRMYRQLFYKTAYNDAQARKLLKPFVDRYLEKQRNENSNHQ